MAAALAGAPTAAIAQVDTSIDQAQTAANGTLSLPNDQTDIGGPPLTDASPRLPRVDYGGPDLTVAIEPGAGVRRGETVAGRSRPAYDPIGFEVAGFRVLPELSSRAVYDSNVFSQSQGRSDVAGRFRGAVAARSDWGRHEAEFDGFIDERAYATYGSENGVTYNAHASGRYDFAAQSSLDAGVSRARVFIERGATTEILQTREPIRYELTSANLGLRDVEGRLTIRVSGIVSRYDYEQAETPDGLPVDERFRDLDLYRGVAEVGYASGAGPAVFASFAAEARRFRYTALIDRDSDGYELLAGVRGDITPLVRGRLGLGYLRYSFDAAGISTRGGLALDLDLDYLVTPLTTISLRGRRDVRNVSSVTLPAAFATTFALGADHELLRNLILSASVSYDRASYVASPLRVARSGVDAGGYLLLSRQIRLDANLAYRRRNESGTTRQRDFDEINGTVGATYRF